SGDGRASSGFDRDSRLDRAGSRCQWYPRACATPTGSSDSCGLAAARNRVHAKAGVQLRGIEGERIGRPMVHAKLALRDEETTMSKMRIEGSFVALVTPFNRDGAVDFGAFRELIRFQAAHGT